MATSVGATEHQPVARLSLRYQTRHSLSRPASAPNIHVDYSDTAPPAIAVMSLRKAVRAFRSCEKCLRAAAPSAM